MIANLSTTLKLDPTRRRRFAGTALLSSALLLSTIAAQPASAVTKKTVKKTARTFSVALADDAETVVAGATASYPFSFRRTGGFRGVVAFDVLDLPQGIKATVVTQSTTRYEVRIQTQASASAGSAVYYLRARSGSIRKLVPFRLTVTTAATTSVAPTTIAPVSPTSIAGATGDFALFADVQPSITRTVAPGQTASYGVRVDRTSFSAPISFRVEGLPAGARASFNPNPSQTNTDLTVTTTSATPPGTYLLPITGSSGGINRAIAVRLVVRRVGQFVLTATPVSIRVNAGNDAVVNASIASVPTGTALPEVTVELQGAPAGVTLQTPVVDGPNTKFILATSAETAAGTYPLTVVGTSGSFTQRLALTLVVTRETPGFGLSAQPESVTVKQASPGTFELKLVPINGFNGRVAYSVAGLPATVVGTFEQGPGGALFLRLSAATSSSLTNVAKTSYPLKITAASGDLSATISVTLLVE